MRIAVLGASGNAGREIARLTAAHVSPGDEFLLVGRNEARLEETRRLVDAAAGRPIATVRRFDLTRDAGLGDLLAGVGLTVVAASVPERTASLAAAVLDAGSHWFDTLLSGRRKLAALRALAPEIERLGRRFVTDGGFHPGLPAALARRVAPRMTVMTRADAYAALKIDWRGESLSDSTIDEVLEMFAEFDSRAWIDGEYRTVPVSRLPRIDFGPPIGVKSCVPMPLDEMEALRALSPALRTAGFHVGGFNPIMDWVVAPMMCLIGRRRSLRRLGRGLTRIALSTIAGSPPPHATVVRLVAEGELAGRSARAEIEVRGTDPYLMTAAPAAACLRRMIDGSITREGLSHQAMIVDPGLFLDDIRAFGLEVEESPIVVD